MTELLTAAQMRAIEQAAIASGEITGLELMERAGRGVVEAIFNDQRSVLPVSTVLDDFHGISGVALSVPCIVDASGATPIKQTRFDAQEWRQFEASAREMRRAAAELGH